MANIWVNHTCPVCKKPVTETGILVAKVKVTSQWSYSSSLNSSHNKVRPNFHAGSKRTLYHDACYKGLGKS